LTSEAAVILSISLVLCGYVIVLLHLIRGRHNSPAWKFIFGGLGLLFVETAIALYLVWGRDVHLSWAELAFVLVMLAKAVFYSIGFTIYYRDLTWLKRRKPVDRSAPPS
jgi:predicted membrane channel-forming protein YqfA (hemolysin III family)